MADLRLPSSSPQATAECYLLLGNVALCAVAFGRINKKAGWLMVPYLAWLGLASALSTSIWVRNDKKKRKALEDLREAGRRD